VLLLEKIFAFGDRRECDGTTFFNAQCFLQLLWIFYVELNCYNTSWICLRSI